MRMIVNHQSLDLAFNVKVNAPMFTVNTVANVVADDGIVNNTRYFSLFGSSNYSQKKRKAYTEIDRDSFDSCICPTEHLQIGAILFRLIWTCRIENRRKLLVFPDVEIEEAHKWQFAIDHKIEPFEA